MHCAIENVLPDPVTPSSTCDVSPRFSPSTSSSIARAWSPRSSKSVTRLKRSYFDAIDPWIVPRLPAEAGRGLPRLGRPVGREIPGTRAEADAFQVLAQQLDFDRAPRAVGAGVRRE